MDIDYVGGLFFLSQPDSEHVICAYVTYSMAFQVFEWGGQIANALRRAAEVVAGSRSGRPLTRQEILKVLPRYIDKGYNLPRLSIFQGGEELWAADKCYRMGIISAYPYSRPGIGGDGVSLAVGVLDYYEVMYVARGGTWPQPPETTPYEAPEEEEGSQLYAPRGGRYAPGEIIVGTWRYSSYGTSSTSLYLQFAPWFDGYSISSGHMLSSTPPHIEVDPIRKTLYCYAQTGDSGSIPRDLWYVYDSQQQGMYLPLPSNVEYYTSSGGGLSIRNVTISTYIPDVPAVWLYPEPQPRVVVPGMGGQLMGLVSKLTQAGFITGLAASGELGVGETLGVGGNTITVRSGV